MNGQQAVNAKALDNEVAPPRCEKVLEDGTAGTGVAGSNLMDEKADVVPEVVAGVGTTTVTEVFPDGGLRAWLVVFGAFWTVFCGFGICGAVGGFQLLYRTSILSNYSESQVAWITSVQAFCTFSPSVVTGSLFDKFGHRPLVGIGGFLLVLGFCMLSLSTQYYQIFLCHVLLIACGTNFLFICPLACVGQWFDRKRGLAFGITLCGASAGAATWPVVLANLPPRVGFAWTCRIMALIAALCAICAFFLLKTRLPPKPKGAFFYVRAFRSTEYSLITFGNAVWCFGYFVFQTYISTYGTLHGLGGAAPYLLIVTNGVSAFGRLGAGFVADRLGVYNTVITGNLCVAILFWVWLACRDTASCFALAACVGIAGGPMTGLQAPLFTLTAPTMSIGGTMLGQALFIQSFVMLMSTPIAGALLGKGTPDQTRSRFVIPIVLCAVLMSTAWGMVVLARLHRSRRIASKV